MNSIILKYIKSLNPKHNDSTKRLYIIIIILLLVLQVFATFSFCKRVEYNSYYNSVSRAVSLQCSSDEDQRSTYSTLAATIASDSGVLRLGDNDNPSYMDLVDICSNIRKLASVSPSVSQVYIYNNQFGYIFDSKGNIYNATDERIKSIKAGIDSYLNTGDNIFLYSQNTMYAPNGICCYIFCTDTTKRDLVIIEDDNYGASSIYARLQTKTLGTLIVTTADGRVIYGGGDYSFGDDISNEPILALGDGNGDYQIVEYGGNKHFLCQTTSRLANRRYISLTPITNITTNSILGKNYIYLYLCILISLLIFAGTFSIWKHFSNVIIEQTVNALNRKNKTRDTQLYRVYGMPRKDGNTTLCEQLSACVGDKPYFTSVIMVIDSFNDVARAFTQSDIKLIKYGIDNILSELFLRDGYELCIGQSLDDKIEYIVASSTLLDADRLQPTIEVCQESICSYINFNTSYFIGKSTAVDKLFDSYEASNAVLKYGFVYGENTVLDTSCLELMSDIELKHKRIANRCMDIIKAEFSDKSLSVDYIADHLNISRSYLSRIYKQATGHALSTTITEYRLDEASKLLIQTDEKVTDIVEATGFTNSSHFTTLFRQRFGVSPTVYRKNHHKI